MNAELWHLVTTVGQRARALLEEQMGAEYAAHELTITTLGPPVLGPQALDRLRAALRATLDEARTALLRRFSEQEAGMVLLPLTISADEAVTRRLARADQLRWPLLQKEIFDIQNGGEVFFTFTEECLQRRETPAFVCAVIYYLLADGFVGRFAGDPARIERVKGQLAERIPLPELPKVKARRRRDLGPAELLASSAPRPVPAPVFYLLAIVSALLLLGLLVALSNL